MALFRRRRSQKAAAPGTSDAEADPSGKDARAATMAHLSEFVSTRVGVEAYVEPATNVTQTTVMLIATDGEWTRRRVPDARAAHALAHQLEIPAYDVQRTGYPQRMRDWNSRQRIERQRAARARAARRTESG